MKYIVLVLVCIFAGILFGQVPPPPPNPSGIPIDGGISALIAMGVGYGIHKYKEKKKDD